jgi:hypothetical protein
MAKTTVVDEPVDYTAMGRLDLLSKARQDHRDLKAAKQSGAPIPATPALDELHRRYEDMTSTRKTTKATEGRTKGRTDIRYFHDGRSMSETHKHKLSTLAYFHSHDLVTGSSARCSTKQFIAELAKLGVTDPGQPGWMVKLPNGVTVECRKDGDASQFKGEAPARKSASKPSAKPAASSKPVAKKTTGTTTGASKPSKPKGKVAKQTPGAKARAAASKQVNPIPKKSTAKKSAPKKTVAAARSTRKTATKR